MSILARVQRGLVALKATGRRPYVIELAGPDIDILAEELRGFAAQDGRDAATVVREELVGSNTVRIDGVIVMWAGEDRVSRVVGSHPGQPIWSSLGLTI